MAKPTRAIIDIGTNSVLLLLGRRRDDGRVEVIDDIAKVARLGQGVAKTGRLAPEAIERTIAILADYRGRADEHGAQIEAVATEGLRLASNQDEFLDRARQALGVAVRLIDGDEEAELSYRSVAAEQAEDAPLRVLDIGGGSTELIVGVGMTIIDRRSHRVGSVRLTEQFIEDDPPSAESLARLEDAAREAFAQQPLQPWPELHGLAGTVTTGAALLLGLDAYDRDAVDGSSFSAEDVRSLRDRLARQTLAERTRPPVLPEGRADVIVAGLSILVVALEHCGAKTLVVRDRGLRFALV